MAKIIKNSSDLFRGFNLTQDMKSSYEEWFSQFRPLTMQERRQLIFITSVNLVGILYDGEMTLIEPPALEEEDEDAEEEEEEECLIVNKIEGWETLRDLFDDWTRHNFSGDELNNLKCPTIPALIVENFSYNITNRNLLPRFHDYDIIANIRHDVNVQLPFAIDLYEWLDRKDKSEIFRDGPDGFRDGKERMWIDHLILDLDSNRRTFGHQSYLHCSEKAKSIDNEYKVRQFHRFAEYLLCTGTNGLFEITTDEINNEVSRMLFKPNPFCAPGCRCSPDFTKLFNEYLNSPFYKY
jgi:hypothetical protein